MKSWIQTILGLLFDFVRTLDRSNSDTGFVFCVTLPGICPWLGTLLGFGLLFVASLSLEVPLSNEVVSFNWLLRLIFCPFLLELQTRWKCCKVIFLLSWFGQQCYDCRCWQYFFFSSYQRSVSWFYHFNPSQFWYKYRNCLRLLRLYVHAIVKT